MKKRMIFFAKILVVAMAVAFFTACDKAEVEAIYAYQISVETLDDVSGPTLLPAAPVMDEVTANYELPFTLTGKKEECDAQARATFDEAMETAQAKANTLTDVSGTMGYALRRHDLESELLKSHTITFPKKDRD